LLIDEIAIGTDPKATSQAGDLQKSVEGSLDRTRKVGEELLNYENISQRETELRAGYADDLRTGRWMSNFRGREILSHFARHHAEEIGYEALRNLIVARMRDSGHQPPGMKAIVERILEE
jgi:hypothetical protein